MKHLRKFETEAEVAMFIKPNVVLVEDTGALLYNVDMPNGVYIQHIDGKLFTTEQWTAGGFANEEANGVAVKTNTARMVIALTNVASTKLPWSSDTSNLISGIVTTDSGVEAGYDISGVENTAILAEIDESGAAYACANYTFPNGAKGYLPALGEWYAVYGIKTQVESALALVGGVTLLGKIGNDKHFWSSTQVDAANAWASNIRTSPRETFTKTYSAYVRAFTTL